MQVEDLGGKQVRLADGARRWIVVSAVVALVGLGAGVGLAASGEHGREHFFQAYLTSFMFFVSLGLGALFFVLIAHLTRAGWSVALRRIAENFAWTLIPLGVFALPIVFGIHDLYHWSHADAVAHDPLLQHKAPWLNSTFFTVRILLYFVVWGVMTWILTSRSLRQDRTGEARITLGLERFSAPATIVYAVTVTLAAFDLLMSLNPHWYSTIFGVYYFAGCLLGFLAVLPIFVSWLQRSGTLSRVVTTEHFHDVGKLMFAFVVFWAYIAFSQYMLIWYGNIPEETIWYEARQTGAWTYLSLALLFGHFFLPFLMLLSRHPKRRNLSLVLGAAWLLLMHWFDLFYLVMPGIRTTGPPLQLVDLACFLGLGGVFVAAALWRMGRTELVPVKDPRLAESLRFENA